MEEHHLAQALRAHLRPDRDNDDRSDNHDADDREVDDARLQIREQLRRRERHGHVRELASALRDPRAAKAVLRREQLAHVHADDGRFQHVEAERYDRHCATDAERHREDLLHENRGVVDKIGRYVGDVGRRNARLAFPPICDLGFLFQATRGKPADCRGDSQIAVICPRKAEIGKERIQQVLPRRRTEIRPRAAAHSTDLIQQAS